MLFILFQEADIYLLDDPLSAVDTHVGRHIFDKCIQDYLKSKTVILVTHQLQYLKDAEQILVLSKGQVLDSGKYDELLNSDKADFYTSFLEREKEEEEEDYEKMSVHDEAENDPSLTVKEVPLQQNGVQASPDKEAATADDPEAET